MEGATTRRRSSVERERVEIIRGGVCSKRGGVFVAFGIGNARNENSLGGVTRREGTTENAGVELYGKPLVFKFKKLLALSKLCNYYCYFIVF